MHEANGGTLVTSPDAKRGRNVLDARIAPTDLPLRALTPFAGFITTSGSASSNESVVDVGPTNHSSAGPLGAINFIL